MSTFLPRKSLNLDFARMALLSGDDYTTELSKLDSLLTFSRSSTATRFNASGALEVVESGQPRFDFDPVTLLPRGLLIEEARTNLVLNSAALATQGVTVTAVPHTLSFWGTGSVALSGAHTGSLAGTGAGNRVTLTFTPSAGTLTLTVTGTVTNAQCEAGTFATSYIPTTGATITRAADHCSTTSLTPWFNPLGGTVLAEASLPSLFPSNYPRVFSFNDGSTNTNSVELLGNNGFLLLSVVSGGVSQATFSAAFTANASFKAAMRFLANNFAGSINGGAVATDISGSIPAVTKLSIAADGAGTANCLLLRRLSCLPYAVSDGVLKALST